ncbi:MAG: rod shape-determining protein MreD [Chloroflexota bacterium]
MLPILSWLTVVVMAASVEVSVLSRLDLWGLRPNVVLLLVVCWSLVRGFEEGTIVGLVGGLAMDFGSGAILGVHTSALALVSMLIALSESTLYRGSLAFFAGTAVLVTACYHGAQLLVLWATSQDIPPFIQLVRVITPIVLINVLLFPAVFVLAQRVARATSGWRQLELD